MKIFREELVFIETEKLGSTPSRHTLPCIPISWCCTGRAVLRLSLGLCPIYVTERSVKMAGGIIYTGMSENPPAVKH